MFSVLAHDFLGGMNDVPTTASLATHQQCFGALFTIMVSFQWYKY